MANQGKESIQGPDIPAIYILDKELKNIGAINDPPEDHKETGDYRKNTEVVIAAATKTTKDVIDYGQNINKKLDEMRKALAKTTLVVQKSTIAALNTFRGDGHRRQLSKISYVQQVKVSPATAIDHTNKLLALEQSKKRLEEAILQAQEIAEKIKDNMACTLDDFDKLKGCIDSWKKAKQESYEDEKRRIEEENRRRDEAEKRRKEETERKRKEEEERRKREEEEKKKREEEERKRREEEERLRLEEEKKIREEAEKQKREEEERLKREEEERKIREEEEKRFRLEKEKRLKEEEEKQKREEEDRLKREEEERKKKEEEEKLRRQLEEEKKRRRMELERIEAERQERERLRQEEEERRRRLDPSNWNPFIYNRDYNEKTEGRTHHQGICCAVMAVPGSIKEDDIQCFASDEDDDILPTLADGEKLLSSVITLDSNKGRINLEAPMRAYIPHNPVHDASDDLVVKVSVNGSDWAMTTLITPSPGSITDKNLRIVGVEIQDYETAKVVVVARPRSQSLIIDKTGTSQYSQSNRNVKIFVPRDAFEKPTECKLSVKSVPDKLLSDLDSGSDCVGPIISTGPLISFTCQTPPSKDIEIDILKSSESLKGTKTVKGKNYQLYKTNKGTWQVADVEFKGRGKDVSITLPSLKYLYSILDIEVPQNTPKEDVIMMAKNLYDTMNKTVVRIIVKQKQENPEHAIFHCIGRHLIPNRIEELNNMGFTSGPDTSREIYIFDGQKLCVTLTGNIESAAEGMEQIVFPFYAYMDTARQSLILRVKDKYKQKDMHEYAGHVHCKILPLGAASSQEIDIPAEHQFDIPISLPKAELPPLHLNSAPIRIPYYLTALAEYVSLKLTQVDQDGIESDTDWFAVLILLESKKSMKALRTRAKPKSKNGTNQEICKIILLDWMKATNAYDDKIQPILSALRKSRLYDLERECDDFVNYQKRTMTDSAMHDIADMVKASPTEFGCILGIEEEVISRCVSENSESATCQKLTMLMEWRTSTLAVEKGTGAFEYLRSLTKNE